MHSAICAAGRLAALVSRPAGGAAVHLRPQAPHGVRRQLRRACQGSSMTEAGDVLPQAQEIKLDKALFDESIPVAAVQVPKRRCHEYMKRLSQ